MAASGAEGTEAVGGEPIDKLHGLRRSIGPAWVWLNRLMWIGNAAPPHPNPSGLDVRGRVLGQVRMWVPTYGGRWFAVVTFTIPYADGRPPLTVSDQLVPYYAIDPYTPPPAEKTTGTSAGSARP